MGWQLKGSRSGELWVICSSLFLPPRRWSDTLHIRGEQGFFRVLLFVSTFGKRSGSVRGDWDSTELRVLDRQEHDKQGTRFCVEAEALIKSFKARIQKLCLFGHKNRVWLYLFCSSHVPLCLIWTVRVFTLFFHTTNYVILCFLCL